MNLEKMLVIKRYERMADINHCFFVLLFFFICGMQTIPCGWNSFEMKVFLFRFLLYAQHFRCNCLHVLHKETTSHLACINLIEFISNIRISLLISLY